MKYTTILILASLTMSGCDNATKPATKSDNSAINQRDQSGSTKTSMDQNENQKDVKITADIRKQLVDTKMSINAQNIKIITQDGNVTLRGPVTTGDEKLQIEAIARKVAGDTKVDSQLDVTKSN